MTWIKPAVVLRALRRGYAAMAVGERWGCQRRAGEACRTWPAACPRNTSSPIGADTDVAYSVKCGPLTWSFWHATAPTAPGRPSRQVRAGSTAEQACYAFSTAVDCSAHCPLLSPHHPALCAVNSGHFVLLPTPAALAFAEAWAATAAANTPRKVAEQKALPPLDGTAYVTCRSACLCYRKKYQLLAEGRHDSVALLATYPGSHLPYTQMGCSLGSPEWAPRIDPCEWQGAAALAALLLECLPAASACACPQPASPPSLLPPLCSALCAPHLLLRGRQEGEHPSKRPLLVHGQ